MASGHETAPGRNAGTLSLPRSLRSQKAQVSMALFPGLGFGQILFGPLPDGSAANTRSMSASSCQRLPHEGLRARIRGDDSAPGSAGHRNRRPAHIARLTGLVEALGTSSGACRDFLREIMRPSAIGVSGGACADGHIARNPARSRSCRPISPDVDLVGARAHPRRVVPCLHPQEKVHADAESLLDPQRHLR